jgi:16S rRNA (cytosine967-C5)-methyltransferase
MPAPPDNRGTASRRTAWRILLEQEAGGVFLKDLFASRLRGFSREDADLIRTICLGVTRWKRLLDYNLDLQAQRGIRDARLRVLLRVGAFQLFFLSGIPAFAIVDTAVEIVKGEFGKSEAGFSNAVLKALARHGLRHHPGRDLKALAVNKSHPDWLVERWSRALAPGALEAALSRNNEEAPLWIRVNPRKTTVEDAKKKLNDDGVETESNPDTPFYLRIVQGAHLALRSEAFAGGKFSFQDPVAYWVATLLDWHPGQTVLDACSAPGGKSALLLELAASRGEDAAQARIVSGDLFFSRLRRIRDARERLGHLELMPVCADVQAPPFKTLFDRILLDAPCSNLGVLRRRPEARWHLTPEKIVALAQRQRELLEKSAALLAPGGRLVYAACSAESVETMEVVEDLLARHPEFKITEAVEQLPAALRKQGCLWVYPGETEYDGFFAAAMVRK